MNLIYLFLTKILANPCNTLNIELLFLQIFLEYFNFLTVKVYSWTVTNKIYSKERFKRKDYYV